MSSLDDSVYVWLTKACSAIQEKVHARTQQHKNIPYRGNRLDFALYRIDIKDAKKKLDAVMCSSDYIADLVAVCPI